MAYALPAVSNKVMPLSIATLKASRESFIFLSVRVQSLSQQRNSQENDLQERVG